VSAPDFTLPADFVERFAADLYRCSSCNYCVDAVWAERGIAHVCATLEYHSPSPGYSGRGFIDAARALLEGDPLDPASVAERVFTCTGCGNCETLCPLGLRPAALGRALRETFHAAGLAPPAIAASYARMRTAHAEQAAESSAEPAERSAIGILAGCSTSAAKTVAALLGAGGIVADVYAGGGACCGARLAEFGAKREAAAWRSALSASRNPRPSTLLVLDYACLEHLQAEAGASVVSFAGWLDTELAMHRLVLALRVDTPRPLHVRLLETCQLKQRPGRSRGDDERRLRARLEALGVVIDNVDYPAPHALCCGAAGGMPSVAPAAAERMAAARRGAQTSAIQVTLDARCAAHLETGAAPVFSLAAFLHRYCTLTPGDAA
jgi:Fe-S oxidoreductase